jgi:hypothetical protein
LKELENSTATSAIKGAGQDNNYYSPKCSRENGANQSICCYIEQAKHKSTYESTYDTEYYVHDDAVMAARNNAGKYARD